MSGHSKWSSIKHKKAAKDAKKGRLFTKLIKEITVAARMGGGDINANPRLRTAVMAAKAASMPAGNIERAIKKGTGELEGVTYEEIYYEGYGPGGTAIMVQVLTDNKNRTVQEIRRLFAKHGGNLGENGCVAWMFGQKSSISVPKSAAKEEDLLEAVLGAGAEDMRDDGETWTILSPYDAHDAVLKALKDAGIEPGSAELTRIPENSVKIEGKQAGAVLRLYDALEEHDDVQNVYANFDIDDEELEKLSA